MSQALVESLAEDDTISKSVGKHMEMKYGRGGS